MTIIKMSLFENKTNDGDLGKLHADHNMNSPGDGKQHFPFASFPPFPFLPRIPVSHGDSMPTPLSLNLTGQIAGDSPRSAGSEDSPKSSPTDQPESDTVSITSNFNRLEEETPLPQTHSNVRDWSYIPKNPARDRSRSPIENDRNGENNRCDTEEAMRLSSLASFRESLSMKFESKETEFLKERLKAEKSELPPSSQPKLPINLPPSLTITTKSNPKELYNHSIDSPTSAPEPGQNNYNPLNLPFNLQGKGQQLPLQLLPSNSQGQPIQQMLTENPVMAAAMQQVLTLPTSTSSQGPAPGFPGLPSSADLMQQAQALQFLAQLQSMFMMNPMMAGQNPSQARSQESQDVESKESLPPVSNYSQFQTKAEVTKLHRNPPKHIPSNHSTPPFPFPPNSFPFPPTSLPSHPIFPQPRMHLQQPRPQRLDLPPDESADLEELEAFSKMFKQKRIKLGYTQGDVGLAMGKLYGNDFSQTTISRFEALNLSFKNMCKLKPLLAKWLEDADANHNTHQQNQFINHHLLTPAQQDAINRRRKKRTSIDTTIRIALERAFNQNPKPTSEEIMFVSDSLNMEKEVVRVWFCNRRQKEKRLNPNSTNYDMESPSNSSSPLPITSFSPPISCSSMTSPLPPFSPYNPSSPPRSSPISMVMPHSIFGAQDRSPSRSTQRSFSPAESNPDQYDR